MVEVIKPKEEWVVHISYDTFNENCPNLHYPGNRYECKVCNKLCEKENCPYVK